MRHLRQRHLQFAELIPHRSWNTRSSASISKVSETQNGTIKFVNLNRAVVMSVPLTSGKCGVLLVGGQSYDVYVYLSSADYYSYDFLLYVPLGVTAFTANFQPTAKKIWLIRPNSLSQRKK